MLTLNLILFYLINAFSEPNTSYIVSYLSLPSLLKSWNLMILFLTMHITNDCYFILRLLTLDSDLHSDWVSFQLCFGHLLFLHLLQIKWGGNHTEVKRNMLKYNNAILQRKPWNTDENWIKQGIKYIQRCYKDIYNPLCGELSKFKLKYRICLLLLCSYIISVSKSLPYNPIYEGAFEGQNNTINIQLIIFVMWLN